jgi:predicted enzyme related to lactoylglutathione lyase
LYGAIVFAKDVQRMAGFYQEALGLRLVSASSTDSWVELTWGSSTLALHGIPPDIAADMTIESPPRPRAGAAIKLTFEAGNLAHTRTRVSTLGGVVLSAQEEAGDCLDPEGNVFRLTGVQS